LESAGVAAADITTYLTTHGTFNWYACSQQLEQIINDKYIHAGVVSEPWTD
jgi:hypothetical protein